MAPTRTSMVYVSGNQHSTHTRKPELIHDTNGAVIGRHETFEIISKVKRISASTMLICTPESWIGSCMISIGGIPTKECLTALHSVTDGEAAASSVQGNLLVSKEKDGNVLHEQNVLIADYDKPVDLPLNFTIKVHFFPLLSGTDSEIVTKSWSEPSNELQGHTTHGYVGRELGTIPFKHGSDFTTLELDGVEPKDSLGQLSLPVDAPSGTLFEVLRISKTSEYQLPEENWSNRPFSFQLHLKVEH